MYAIAGFPLHCLLNILSIKANSFLPMSTKSKFKTLKQKWKPKNSFFTVGLMFNEPNVLIIPDKIRSHYFIFFQVDTNNIWKYASIVKPDEVTKSLFCYHLVGWLVGWLDVSLIPGKNLHFSLIPNTQCLRFFFFRRKC